MFAPTPWGSDYHYMIDRVNVFCYNRYSVDRLVVRTLPADRPGEVSVQPQVVIVVEGGVVQQVYGDEGLNIVLVDWDNIADGDTAVKVAACPLVGMDVGLQRKVQEAQ